MVGPEEKPEQRNRVAMELGGDGDDGRMTRTCPARKQQKQARK